MAPRGGGPGGPRLLSILSSLAFDGPFSIQTGTYHEKESQETAGSCLQGSSHVSSHQVSANI